MDTRSDGLPTLDGIPQVEIGMIQSTEVLYGREPRKECRPRSAVRSADRQVNMGVDQPGQDRELGEINHSGASWNFSSRIQLTDAVTFDQDECLSLQSSLLDVHQ